LGVPATCRPPLENCHQGRDGKNTSRLADQAGPIIRTTPIEFALPLRRRNWDPSLCTFSEECFCQAVSDSSSFQPCRDTSTHTAITQIASMIDLQMRTDVVGPGRRAF